MTLPKPRPPLTPGETKAYPVLPLRDIVVFPHMIVPLFVGARSRSRLWKVMRSDTFILLATQKNASDDDPPPIRSMRSVRSQACCSCSSCPTAPSRC